MLKLLTALAAVCLVTPAFAGPACDPAELDGALQQAGVVPLGVEPLDHTPIVVQIGQHGPDIVVIFTVNGCPERRADGTIAAHRVRHDETADPAPAVGAKPAPAKLPGGGAEIGI